MEGLKNTDPAETTPLNVANKFPLPWGTKLAYGTGHILNDLASTMWCIYLLIFFQKVLQMDSLYSGYIFLIGFIVDGIASVATGYLSDIQADCWLYTKWGIVF